MSDQLKQQIFELVQSAIIAEPTYCIGFVLIGVIVTWVGKESYFSV